MHMQGEILTLDNNKEYTVVFSTKFNNCDYIYVVNNNDYEDVNFYRCDEDSLYEIEDHNLITNLIGLFYNSASKLLNEELLK